DTVAARLATADEVAQGVLAALGTNDRDALAAVVDDRLTPALAPRAQDLATLGAAERRAAAAGLVVANDEIRQSAIRLALVGIAA
ncbi:hypothetical protein ABTL87_19430, partial [Acinetobacter baumannii]